MIEYKTGDILREDADAIINTVVSDSIYCYSPFGQRPWRSELGRGEAAH